MKLEVEIKFISAFKKKKRECLGVSVVAQWIKDPT